MEKLKIGRPKGSNSTIGIRLRDFIKHLAPNADLREIPNIVIMVGTTWLENMGYTLKPTEIAKIKSYTPTNDNIVVEVKDLQLD